jgi:hypothetical protein
VNEAEKMDEKRLGLPDGKPALRSHFLCKIRVFESRVQNHKKNSAFASIRAELNFRFRIPPNRIEFEMAKADSQSPV